MAESQNRPPSTMFVRMLSRASSKGVNENHCLFMLVLCSLCCVASYLMQMF
jgi:hypothetical protein